MNRNSETHALIFVPEDPNLEPICVKTLTGDYTQEQVQEIFDFYMKKYSDSPIAEPSNKDIDCNQLREDLAQLQAKHDSLVRRINQKSKRQKI